MMLGIRRCRATHEEMLEEEREETQLWGMMVKRRDELLPNSVA